MIRASVRFLSALGSLATALSPTLPAKAKVLDVPGDYPGIATAIAAASYGDTVLVHEGSWYTGYHVRVPTGISILAAGTQEHTSWYIPDGLDFNTDPEKPAPSMIRGFHLQIETGTVGGGILVYHPGTVIRSNYFEDLWAGYSGNPIYCLASALIEGNIFVLSMPYGVVIAPDAGRTVVRRNVFTQCPPGVNLAAMEILYTSNPADTVLVYGNTFGYMTGKVEVFFGSSHTTNVEFVNNIFDSIGGDACILCTGPGVTGYLGIRYNLFYGEEWWPGCSGVDDCEEVAVIGPGNIFGESAEFCLDWCEDYRLEPTSPAIGSGENGTTMGACDEICGVIDVPEPPGPGGPPEAGPVYPNPATSVVTLPVTGMDGEAVVMRVFDGSGRLIQTIETLVKGGIVHWDGRDGKRRPVESGVYFLDLRRGDGGAITHQRVRILR